MNVGGGPEGVAIRPYRPADEPSWLRCRVLAFLPTGYYDDVRVDKPAIADGLELVAVDDDVVVGLLDVSVDGADATIESVAVHPDRCRQGVGTALLERALGDMRERGVRRIEAWTREDAAANGWYRRRGFVESQRYLHVYADGHDEVRAAQVSAAAELIPVHTFLHLLDMDRETEMRERFGRVYVCRCYERPIGPGPTG
jgi:ribosomal protein S18 acetylase RimI-like enzyme